MELNRFALTALSRNNKSVSVAEEILLHKKTGQQLVKTTDGDVISSEHLARLNEHFDMATIRAQLMNIRGDMYMIDFDNIELPEVVTDNQALIPSVITLKSSNCKSIYFSIDLDIVEVLTNNVKLVNSDPIVTIVMEVMNGASVAKTVTITKGLSDINTSKWEMNNEFATGTNTSTYLVRLKSLSVKRPNSYLAGVALRNILHSVVVVVE